MKIQKQTVDFLSKVAYNLYAQFELDYYGKYTNEYQIFTLINGTLLIKGVDRWGNPIEIDITSV